MEQKKELASLLKETTLSAGMSKAAVKRLAEEAVSSVLANSNPLEVAEQITLMEQFCEAVKKHPKFREYALEEIAKYGKRYKAPSGALLELAETGTKYYYDRTGDEKLFDLYRQREELNEQIAEREKFLRGLPPQGLDVRYKDQLLHVYPPYKKYTTSYKVTITK